MSIELTPPASGNTATAPCNVPERHAGGRPSLYKPEFCAMVIAHMASNHGLTAFAGVIGVNPRTVYQWAQKIPEFGEAVDIGRGKRIFAIEKMLAKPKSGPEIAGAIFLAKNVMPSEYREKIEHSHEGMTDTAVSALTESIRFGVADALRQLGAQTVEAMRGIRILDHGTMTTQDVIHTGHEDRAASEPPEPGAWWSMVRAGGPERPRR